VKVIFLQDVRNVAHKNDVKEVSEGYARNFLLPSKLAEVATEQALKKIAEAKANHEKESEQMVKHLHLLAKTISGMTIQFELEADKSGSVFGSVNKEAIAKALREHHLVTNERVEVIMEQPIKKLGDHEVVVDLKHGIEAKLKIKVIAKA
jgi:large subunit ribosomal protein L9